MPTPIRVQIDLTLRRAARAPPPPPARRYSVQVRSCDFRHHPADWEIVSEALTRFDAPLDDGVAAALADAGFGACWDLVSTN